MWNVINCTDLIMAEGDFGIDLPCEIDGAELSDSDSIKFTIKYRKNGEVKLEKECNITNNTFNLRLTKSESDRLPVGIYVYSLDWYKDNIFMCNIVLDAEFKVVDKA